MQVRGGGRFESDETWTAPDVVDSTASGALDPQVLWNPQHQVPPTLRSIQTHLHLHPPPSPRPNDPQ